jgi:hypothetical protein
MSNVLIPPAPDETVLDNLRMAAPKQKEFISDTLLSDMAKKLSDFDESKAIIALVTKIPYDDFVVSILNPNNTVDDLLIKNVSSQANSKGLKKDYEQFMKSISNSIHRSKLTNFFEADKIIKDHPSFKYLFHNNNDNDQSFTVTGKVTYANGTIAAAAQLLVQAFHVNLKDTETLLNEAPIDAKGYYNIKYSSKDFRQSGQDQLGPNLRVKVLDNSGKVIATSELFPNAKIDQTVDITIKEQLQAPSNSLVVSGHVTKKDGTPIPEVTVIAIDKDLRIEQELGRTKTDESGHYKIRYTKEQFTRAEKESADLLILVEDSGGTKLQSQPPLQIMFNAPPKAIIDLTIGGEFSGPSEYERLLAEIKP